MIVITDERASDRLLTASSVTAMECDKIPMTALKSARKRLAAIPTILVQIMI
jgi:hypothetical protein